MAKKDKKIRETTIENYYDLKTDKIDELVAALKDGNETDGEISMNISDCTGVDSPENVTYFGKQKKFNPYRTDFLSRVPAFIKALLVKWWFAGAVCFFIMWGIPFKSPQDSVLLCGAVLGVVVDLLVNPLFRFMETDKREFDAYTMFPFPFKAYWTFFANIIYYVAVLFCVNFCYTGINLICNLSAGTEGAVYLGVEPLLFGVIAVVADMLFIGIKDGIVYLVRRRKVNV